MAKLKIYAFMSDDRYFRLGYKAPVNGLQWVRYGPKAKPQFIGGCPEPLGGTVEADLTELGTLQKEIREESGGVLEYVGKELPKPFFSKTLQYSNWRGDVLKDQYNYYDLPFDEIRGKPSINPLYANVKYPREAQEMLGVVTYDIAKLSGTKSLLELGAQMVLATQASEVFGYWTKYNMGKGRKLPLVPGDAQACEFFGTPITHPSITLQAIDHFLKHKSANLQKG